MLITRLATTLVDGLRSRIGGGDVYIPALGRSARNAAIREEFYGRKMTEICRRYNIKPSTAYRIVGAVGLNFDVSAHALHFALC